MSMENGKEIKPISMQIPQPLRLTPYIITTYPLNNVERSSSKSDYQYLEDDYQDPHYYEKASLAETFEDVEFIVEPSAVQEVEDLHHHETVEDVSRVESRIQRVVSF